MASSQLGRLNCCCSCSGSLPAMHRRGFRVAGWLYLCLSIWVVQASHGYAGHLRPIPPSRSSINIRVHPTGANRRWRRLQNYYGAQDERPTSSESDVGYDDQGLPWLELSVVGLAVLVLLWIVGMVLYVFLYPFIACCNCVRDTCQSEADAFHIIDTLELPRQPAESADNDGGSYCSSTNDSRRGEAYYYS